MAYSNLINLIVPRVDFDDTPSLSRRLIVSALRHVKDEIIRVGVAQFRDPPHTAQRAVATVTPTLFCFLLTVNCFPDVDWCVCKPCTAFFGG
jgi:hypothetical protein